MEKADKLLTEVVGLEMELKYGVLTFRLDGESASVPVMDKEAAWLTRAFGLRDAPGRNLLKRVMEIMERHEKSVASNPGH